MSQQKPTASMICWQYYFQVIDFNQTYKAYINLVATDFSVTGIPELILRLYFLQEHYLSYQICKADLIIYGIGENASFKFYKIRWRNIFI